jgi:hypothetical protein
MKFHKTRRVLSFVVALVAFLSGSAIGQVTDVHLPDGNAGTGLTCNMIPFSSVFGAPVGAWTHLQIIPASMLQAGGVQPGQRLVDIRFAPCGSGTVQMQNVQVFVGHLQAPLPTFSLLDGFVDPTPVYDSAVSGPLAFNCVANTWSSLGIGGGNLAWNGTSDVGIFTTHVGLSISSTTGWQGSFWRDATMMRHYRNAFQATMALTSALSGLKIALTFADPTALPPSMTPYGQATAGSSGTPLFFAPEAPSLGNSAFVLGVVQARPGALGALLISSAPADLAIGVGSDVRLLADLSPAAGYMIVPVAIGGSGSAFFPAPLPHFAPGLAGLAVYCQWAIIGDPNGQPTIYGIRIPLAFTGGLAVTLGV